MEGPDESVRVPDLWSLNKFCVVDDVDEVVRPTGEALSRGELKAWYDPGPGAGFVVTTPAQADELLERMVSESASEKVGLMAQIALKGDGEGTWSSLLQFGVRAAKCGFVGWAGGGRNERGVISDNGATSPTDVLYDYQTHERPVPSNAEVPMATVHQAVLDYVSSGGARPGGVSWRVV
ncbi:predicted protein [Streptomyces sp. AA4]|nr:predicted protein [Streptomyces sp. AA4]